MLRALAPSLVIAALAAVCSGCYRSHLREEPTDAGVSVDASEPDGSCVIYPIPGTGCPEQHLTIDVELAFGPRPTVGGGTLVISGRDGSELLRAGAHADGIDDHRAGACVCAREAPLELLLLQEGVSQSIRGVREDLVGRSLARPLYGLADDRLRGTLVRQHPENRFLVQLDPAGAVATIVASPFAAPCGRPAAERCWLRFLELSSAGELLGGGADRGQPGGVREVVLRATETSVRHDGAFEASLPTGGMLATLPLTEVRPLTCGAMTPNGSFGGAMPGRPELWRCRFAGVASIEEVDGRVARGTFSYLDGAEIGADTLMARLGSPGDGLEAHVLVPCCDGERPLRFGFASVERLEGGGRRGDVLGVDVEASSYEHAFVFLRSSAGRDFRIWDFEDDGVMSVAPSTASVAFRELMARYEPFGEVWVGAVTTRGNPPWDDGLRVQMVHRRVVESD